MSGQVRQRSRTPRLSKRELGAARGALKHLDEQWPFVVGDRLARPGMSTRDHDLVARTKSLTRAVGFEDHAVCSPGHDVRDGTKARNRYALASLGRGPIAQTPLTVQAHRPERATPIDDEAMAVTARDQLRRSAIARRQQPNRHRGKAEQ